MNLTHNTQNVDITFLYTRYEQFEELLTYESYNLLNNVNFN